MLYHKSLNKYNSNFKQNKWNIKTKINWLNKSIKEILNIYSKKIKKWRMII